MRSEDGNLASTPPKVSGLGVMEQPSATRKNSACTVREAGSRPQGLWARSPGGLGPGPPRLRGLGLFAHP